MKPVDDPLTHEWDCLHIDVDGLVYGVLNSMENRTYLCEDGKEYPTLKEVKAADTKAVKLEQRLPKGTRGHHVLAAFRNTLDKLVNTYKHKDYKCPMSHHDSSKLIRHKIATTAGYKETRRTVFNPRPLMYHEVRNKVKSSHNGFVVKETLEADDWLGLHQRENTLLLSKDKDLNSVPGHHINLNTGEYFFVDPDEVGTLELKENRKDLKGTGFKWFCAQMLLGDSSDNIKGVKGFGPVKVEGLLGPLESKQACWDWVKRMYRKYDGGNARVAENAQLLWMPHRWDCLSNWINKLGEEADDE